MPNYRAFTAQAKLTRSIKWIDLINQASRGGMRDHDDVLEFYWIDEGLVIVRNNKETILVHEDDGLRSWYGPLEFGDSME